MMNNKVHDDEVMIALRSAKCTSMTHTKDQDVERDTKQLRHWIRERVLARLMTTPSY
jgi:hypothetical protein